MISTKKESLRPRSKKREAQEREYRALRLEFLSKHPDCQRCGNRATQVHHRRGRCGQLLTDPDWFMAVCSPCHDFIELHPQQAKDAGWSLSRLAKI
jgi:hypothetical protein